MMTQRAGPSVHTFTMENASNAIVDSMRGARSRVHTARRKQHSLPQTVVKSLWHRSHTVMIILSF